jgi:hypothetical protein
MFCTSTLIWNSPYFNFFCHSIWNARMSSARALTRQTFLVLPEYCSFSKVVLQYQYQGSSIVLQYKTARLVHPWRWSLCLCQKWTEQADNRVRNNSRQRPCQQTLPSRTCNLGQGESRSTTTQGGSGVRAYRLFFRGHGPALIFWSRATF